MGKITIKLAIKIYTLETVNAICAICQKYKEYFDVDVCYGHYVTDGISVLGVASMMGNIVEVKPLYDFEDDVFHSFVSDMKEIGAQDY